jgi:hypothetical protein
VILFPTAPRKVTVLLSKVLRIRHILLKKYIIKRVGGIIVCFSSSISLHTSLPPCLHVLLNISISFTPTLKQCLNPVHHILQWIPLYREDLNIVQTLFHPHQAKAQLQVANSVSKIRRCLWQSDSCPSQDESDLASPTIVIHESGFNKLSHFIIICIIIYHNIA